MAAAKDKGRYHKGNVRPALIATAIEMLKTDAISGLSLNKIARAVGVSPPAVYNHFRNKEALLAAVAVEGFERLIAVQQTGENSKQPLIEVMRASAVRYLEFAYDDPNLYRLMFRHEIENRDDYPLLIAVEDKLFALSARRLYPDYSPDAPLRSYPLVLTFWAAMHGFAMLIADEQLQARTRGDLVAYANMAVDLLIGGASKGAPAGRSRTPASKRPRSKA